jgi:hypothetical protein
MGLRLTLFGLVVFFCNVSVWAQGSYNIHFRSAEVDGRGGGPVTLEIGVDNTPGEVTGFSLGVLHDPAVLTIEEVGLGPAIEAVLGQGNSPDGDFFQLNTTPEGGAGFTIAMLFSAAAMDLVLPAGTDHHILNARYAIASAAPPAQTAVSITGDLGSPQVAVVLDRSGLAQLPTGTATTTAVVLLSGDTTAVAFVRGDVNQNGRLDSLDTILTVDYLFGGAKLEVGAATRDNCLVIMNYNGSMAKGDPDIEDFADIDISDMLGVVLFLFQRGAPPPAPFPQCGQPDIPVSANVACTASACSTP